MKTRLFSTLVKEDHKLGGNEYVVGRISGMGQALMEIIDNHKGEMLAMDANVSGTVFIIRMICSESVYEAFTKMVKKHYPDL